MGKKKEIATDNTAYMRVEGGTVVPFTESSYKAEIRFIKCSADGEYLEKPRFGTDIIEASGFPIAEG